jgi:hypothetical protein
MSICRIQRRQRNSAEKLLQAPAAVDAVNLAIALQRQMQQLSHIEIDHRPVGSRVDKKLTSDLPPKLVVMPTPRAGDERADISDPIRRRIRSYHILSHLQLALMTCGSFNSCNRPNFLKRASEKIVESCCR